MRLLNISLEFSSILQDAISGVETNGHWRPGPCHHWLIGNGGSAAVCSHVATDMLKAGYSAFVVGDPASITMLANDEGHDNVYATPLKLHARPGDTLIAISSSGRSENILLAVRVARECRMGVVTFSGFDSHNPLRSMGDINYYVPSHNYGIVELSTLAILHSVVNSGL